MGMGARDTAGGDLGVKGVGGKWVREEPGGRGMVGNWDGSRAWGVELGGRGGRVGVVFATGQGGAKICRPAPAPAGVLAHNLLPAPPRWLIRGPAIKPVG